MGTVLFRHLDFSSETGKVGVMRLKELTGQTREEAAQMAQQGDIRHEHLEDNQKSPRIPGHRGKTSAIPGSLHLGAQTQMKRELRQTAPAKGGDTPL